VIVAPSGKVLAGPLREESGILYGDIDLETARAARKSLDVTGHYARADIFHLEVDRRLKPPATFVDLMSSS
jgi:nitrilase